MLNYIKIHFNKAKITGLVVLTMANFSANCQSFPTLDSILDSFNNADLYVAPIIRGVAIVRDTNREKSKRVLPMFTVSSLDQRIIDIASFYSTDTVLKRLFRLLNDPQRDLYANALLYELVDDRKLGRLMFLKKDEWISSGRQSCDIDFWQTYLSAKGLIERKDPIRYY